MRPALGFALCLALSGALHWGGLVAWPSQGSTGQGAGGDDALTMAASSASLSALAEAWSTPPQTATAPSLTAPEITAEPPAPTPEQSRPSRIEPLSLPEPPTETQPTQPQALEAPRIAAPSVTGPALRLPSLEGGTLPLVPTPTEPQPARASPEAPGLPDAPDIAAPPQAVEAPGGPVLPPPAPAPPEADPRFPDASVLATASSLRPRQRPEGLAPAPPPFALQPNPAPSPSVPSLAAPERIGGGTGGGTGTGNAPAPTDNPGLSPGQIQSLTAQWGGQIRARIARGRPSVRVPGPGHLAPRGRTRWTGHGPVDRPILRQPGRGPSRAADRPPHRPLSRRARGPDRRAILLRHQRHLRIAGRTRPQGDFPFGQGPYIPPMAALLQLTDVSKTYPADSGGGALRVLDGVSLSLEAACRRAVVLKYNDTIQHDGRRRRRPSRRRGRGRIPQGN